MDNFYKALAAESLAEALQLLDLDNQTPEDIEGLAFSYGFHSEVITQREEDLTKACLDKLEELEA